MNKNTIFYYRFQENGETVIGQAKFLSLQMKVREMSFFENEHFAGGLINTGNVIIAPTMEVVEIGDVPRNRFQLYPTFEDAVAEKNPVFDNGFERYHFNHTFAETICDTLQDVWDTLPECLDLKRYDYFGNAKSYYVPIGYKWDGTKAVQTKCSDVIAYDLLEHQCVVTDWGALDGVYYSEEGCKANNTVKCYTF